MKRDTSCRANRNFGFAARCEILASLPVTRLSRHSTSQPRASINSHKCDPRNPAPPVMTARNVALLCCSTTGARCHQLSLKRSSPDRGRRSHRDPGHVMRLLWCRCGESRRVVRHHSPALRKFSEVQSEYPRKLVAFPHQMKLPDYERCIRASHVYFHVREGKLAHRLSVWIVFLVTLVYRLPAASQSAGPGENRLVRFPVPGHESSQVAAIPVRCLRLQHRNNLLFVVDLRASARRRYHHHEKQKHGPQT